MKKSCPEVQFRLGRISRLKAESRHSQYLIILILLLLSFRAFSSQITCSQLFVESQTHGKNNFDAVVSLGQNGGSILRPVNIQDLSLDLSKPVLRSYGQKWDPSELMTPHAPVLIGEVAEKNLFTHPQFIQHVQYLKIKKPGSNYFIPKELVEFESLIQQIIDFEHTVNPLANDYFVYVTIDHSFVPAGTKQRLLQAHVDSQYEKSDRIDRVYAVTDENPTVFYPHEFQLPNQNLSHQAISEILNSQKRVSESVRFLPYQIALFDAYSVHESGSGDADHFRTFFRLTFSRRLLSKGLTKSINLNLP